MLQTVRCLNSIIKIIFMPRKNFSLMRKPLGSYQNKILLSTRTLSITRSKRSEFFFWHCDSRLAMLP